MRKKVVVKVEDFTRAIQHFKGVIIVEGGTLFMVSEDRTTELHYHSPLEGYVHATPWSTREPVNFTF